jgi:hypothetical protein
LNILAIVTTIALLLGSFFYICYSIGARHAYQATKTTIGGLLNLHQAPEHLHGAVTTATRSLDSSPSAIPELLNERTENAPACRLHEPLTAEKMPEWRDEDSVEKDVDDSPKVLSNVSSGDNGYTGLFVPI